MWNNLFLMNSRCFDFFLNSIFLTSLSRVLFVAFDLKLKHCIFQLLKHWWALPAEACQQFVPESILSSQPKFVWMQPNHILYLLMLKIYQVKHVVISVQLLMTRGFKLQLRKNGVLTEICVMCFGNEVVRAHNLLIVGMEVSIYMIYSMGWSLQRGIKCTTSRGNWTLMLVWKFSVEICLICSWCVDKSGCLRDSALLLSAMRIFGISSSFFPISVVFL